MLFVLTVSSHVTEHSVRFNLIIKKKQIEIYKLLPWTGTQFTDEFLIFTFEI